MRLSAPLLCRVHKLPLGLDRSNHLSALWLESGAGSEIYYSGVVLHCFPGGAPSWYGMALAPANSGHFNGIFVAGGNRFPLPVIMVTCLALSATINVGAASRPKRANVPSASVTRPSRPAHQAS
jgi:hypothetical protein